MLEVKVNVNETQMFWKPDDSTFEEVKERLEKDESPYSCFLANVLSDVTNVCMSMTKYLEDKLGKGFADLFKESAIENPRLLFGDYEGLEDQ